MSTCDDIEPLDWDVIYEEEIIQSRNSCKEFQVDES